MNAQAAIRQRDHKASNAERKLTPAERKEKKVAKLTEGTDLELEVVVFRIQSLHDPGHKFKVSSCTCTHHTAR